MPIARCADGEHGEAEIASCRLILSDHSRGTPMKKSSRPTVSDLLDMKGKRQLTMLRVTTLDEADAAERAGIDMVSVPPALLGPEFREAAPHCFAVPGSRIWRLRHGRRLSA